PFIRLTTKLYDRTPEEIERARQRHLDDMINLWAWKMINVELATKDSPVVRQFNEYYGMAQAAHDRGDIEEAQRIYKDIIVAGQMMFEEAAHYVRNRIDVEDKLKGDYDQATELFRHG